MKIVITIILPLLLLIFVVNGFGRDTTNFSKRIIGKWGPDYSKRWVMKIDGKEPTRYPLSASELFFSHLQFKRNKKARLQQVDRGDVFGLWQLEGHVITFSMKGGQYSPLPGREVPVTKGGSVSYNIVYVDKKTLILSLSFHIGSGELWEAVYFYVKNKN